MFIGVSRPKKSREAGDLNLSFAGVQPQTHPFRIFCERIEQKVWGFCTYLAKKRPFCERSEQFFWNKAIFLWYFAPKWQFFPHHLNSKCSKGGTLCFIFLFSPNGRRPKRPRRPPETPMIDTIKRLSLDTVLEVQNKKNLAPCCASKLLIYAKNNKRKKKLKKSPILAFFWKKNFFCIKSFFKVFYHHQLNDFS